MRSGALRDAGLTVADLNTYPAAGQAVADAFRATGHPLLEPFIFRAPNLHAEHRFVEELEPAMRPTRPFL